MQSLWMLAAAFSFTVMSVCIKLSSDIYSPAEVLLFRGIIGIAFVVFLARLQGGTLRTRYLGEHVRRGMMGATALGLAVWGLSVLSVATSMTLNYLSSIWIAAVLFFVAWRRKEKSFDWTLAGTIALSFIGIALLLRPTMDASQLIGGLATLFASFLTAGAYLQVRKLGLLGEPEYRVVFYFSVTGLLLGFFWTIVDGKMPFIHTSDPVAISLLVAIGITATLGQILLTRAYRLGNPLLTANLQYSGILFASVLSIAIWGNELDMLGWLGIAIILASAIGATFHQHRTSRRPAHTSKPAA